MRISRLKFTEIDENKSFIELLKVERDLNSSVYAQTSAKILAGEYMDNKYNLFEAPLSDLENRLLNLDNDNRNLSSIIVKNVFEYLLFGHCPLPLTLILPGR